ncbi:hypothetical protein [Ruficoccus sp. ZRK36]|uniref:hypothetical protein n=1 Tax=Ruficoccus sp. ZRK36 TaxID=2866311 RepID=UPI001C73392F|nr:hypothetical protein [Ruficoccus sp. ZRK36]QYY36764.1 hypothetical protein K0V07_04630 [Ruficoccus sp. ZRK36]
MNNHLKCLVALSGLLAATGTLSAANLFFDNFDSYPAGDAIPAGTGQNWSEVKTSVSFTAETDSSHIFSESSNQYALMQATAATTNVYVASKYFSGTLTGEVSMKFYDNSEDAFAGNGWSLRIGNSGGNSGTAFGVFIENGQIIRSANTSVSSGGGTITSYSFDTVNDLNIVFNNSEDVLTYSGGSVASGKMDVYLNGVLVGNDLDGCGESNIADTEVEATIRVINFTAKVGTENPFTSTLYLDEISVDSEASIPEPAESGICIGLGILALAWLRRRFLRK